ncbi:MAG TPA: toprim domain-containing protein, partial [bacterium]|nr:toprim domain-containing protein [bacterium]
MKVMIVEKPSMKRKMEAALGDEVKVVSSVGHIESLADLESYLEKKFENGQKPYWKDVLKHLPFIPEVFRHTVTNPKVFYEIEKALKNATEIILGADPDREGELIHRNILEIAK